MDADASVRQCRVEASGRMRVLPTSQSMCGSAVSRVGSRKTLRQWKAPRCSRRVAAVRAADPAGNLGCFHPVSLFQAWQDGSGDDEVSGLLLVSLYTAACMPARGFSTDAGGASRSANSEPWFRARVARCRERATSRGGRNSFLIEVRSSIGVLGLCCWLQKSARGIGLREAVPVAAGAGDGGLALRRLMPSGSEGMSGAE